MEMGDKMTRRRHDKRDMPSTDCHIVIIGIGPAGPGALPQSVKDQITNAREIWAPEDLLNMFPAVPVRHRLEMKKLKNRLSQIYSRSLSQKILILCYGDPGLNGLVSVARASCTADQIEIHPQVDPIQQAFATLKIPWLEVRVLHTAFEKLSNIRATIRQHATVAVYTSTELPGDDFLKWIKKKGIVEDSRTVIFWPENGIWSHIHFLDPSTESPPAALPATCLFLFLQERKWADFGPTLPLSLAQISDESFEINKCISSNQMIRNLIFNKISLLSDEILWDVGASEGAFSIACAQGMDLQAAKGRVFALEWESSMFQCFLKNLSLHATKRLKLFNGSLPDVMSLLEDPDVVLIQERTSPLADILPLISKRMAGKGRILIKVNSFIHAHQTTQILEELGFEVEVSMVPQEGDGNSQLNEETTFLCLILGKAKQVNR